MEGPWHHFCKHVFFCIQLVNGKRYNVDIDVVICTMSIPSNLSRFSQIKSYLT